MLLLAHCYVVAKVYKVATVYVIQSPPCRAHIHMFTIIQFLRVRANIHTVLEGQQHARKQWARKQLLTNPSLCMQYRNTCPSGFMLLYCIQTSGIGQ